MSYKIPTYDARPLVIADATESESGVMSPEDKIKLDSLDPENLQVCHITGTCATPTFTPGPGCGTSPSVDVIGTDLAGYVSITPDLDATGGDIGFLTYTRSYDETPVVVLTPASFAAASGGMPSATQEVFADLSNSDNTGFQLTMYTAVIPLSSEGTYVWAYHVIGQPS